MTVTETEVAMFAAGKKRGMSKMFVIQFGSSIVAACAAAFCNSVDQAIIVFSTITLTTSFYFISIN